MAEVQDFEDHSVERDEQAEKQERQRLKQQRRDPFEEKRKKLHELELADAQTGFFADQKKISAALDREQRSPKSVDRKTKIAAALDNDQVPDDILDGDQKKKNSNDNRNQDDVPPQADAENDEGEFPSEDGDSSKPRQNQELVQSGIGGETSSLQSTLSDKDTEDTEENDHTSHERK